MLNTTTHLARLLTKNQTHLFITSFVALFVSLRFDEGVLYTIWRIVGVRKGTNKEGLTYTCPGAAG